MAYILSHRMPSADPPHGQLTLFPATLDAGTTFQELFA
jgi:hypothetical protein